MRDRISRECRTIQGQLGPYLRGELGREQTLRIQRHLEGCRECREALALEGILLDAVEAYPPLPVPEGFADRVMERWADEMTPTGAIYSLWDLPRVASQIIAVNLRWTRYRLRFGLTLGYRTIVATLLYTGEQLRETYYVYRRVIAGLKVSLSSIHPLTEE